MLQKSARCFWNALARYCIYAVAVILFGGGWDGIAFVHRALQHSSLRISLLCKHIKSYRHCPLLQADDGLGGDSAFSRNVAMPAQLNNPEYWRFRAEEVRTIADEMNHDETKKIMARIAEDYERIGADI